MAEKSRFKVVRRHMGDRMYEVGETREGSKHELSHLVPHVLEELGPVKAKAEPPVANKAEAGAPENKTEAGDPAAKGARARRNSGE